MKASDGSDVEAQRRTAPDGTGPFPLPLSQQTSGRPPKTMQKRRARSPFLLPICSQSHGVRSPIREAHKEKRRVRLGRGQLTKETPLPQSRQRRPAIFLQQLRVRKCHHNQQCCQSTKPRPTALCRLRRLIGPSSNEPTINHSQLRWPAPSPAACKAFPALPNQANVVIGMVRGTIV